MGLVDAAKAKAKAVHEASEKGKEQEMDGEAASLVRCVRGWFCEAAALGRGLVAYYH